MNLESKSFADLKHLFLSEGFSYNREDLEEAFLLRSEYSAQDFVAAKSFFSECDPNIESVIVPFLIVKSKLPHESSNVSEIINVCCRRRIIAILDCFTSEFQGNLGCLVVDSANNLLGLLETESALLEKLLLYGKLKKQLTTISRAATSH